MSTEFLAVDDDAAMRRLLVVALRDLGQVTVVATKVEALRLLDARDFDLVITDLSRPGPDYGFVDELVERGMATIVVTAYALPQTARSDQRGGKGDHEAVPAPVLRELVQDTLGAGGGQPSLQRSPIAGDQPV